jgi:hypothetical protein
MFEFLKSKNFHYLFSFLIGFGVVAILRPICDGNECIVEKAPPLSEVNSSTYQLGSKCYQFRSSAIECPRSGIVESFYIKV